VEPRGIFIVPALKMHLLIHILFIILGLNPLSRSKYLSVLINKNVVVELTICG
jgi:hypothetical protein